jgi:hypothetical protein
VPSVKNVPADDEAVVITAAPDPPALPLAAALPGADAPAGALPPDAPAAPPLLPLEHAATKSATPAAPPTPATSRPDPDNRFTMVFVIVLSPV